MRYVRAYDLFIFDCDGVIFDSNKLKITAMRDALNELEFDDKEVLMCCEYFQNNFGESRYHHVRHFINTILKLSATDNPSELQSKIIEKFSVNCQELYSKAEMTPGFLEFLQQLDGKKYIASGSAQDELREVFVARKISQYFDGIYGSPKKKSDNVKHILELEGSTKGLMFGDAISDLNASIENKIDFVAYRPFSNVADKLTTKTKDYGFKVVDHWDELL